MQGKHTNAFGHQNRKPRISNQRIVNIVFGLIAILVALDVSTQKFAYNFSYNEHLGDSYFHLYAPWKIVEWTFRYHATRWPEIHEAGAVGLVTYGFLLILLMFRSRFNSNSSTASEFIHGSARWAKEADIRAAGLLGDEGVYVGAWRDKRNKLRFLLHNGPEHVLCFAPTRSGKGVGLVVPTLLSWQKSAVVLDLKGELWELTAGWRRECAHNKVLRFEPADDKHSIGFNPLEEIRLIPRYEVGDVQNLATLMVDPDGRGLNDHWQKTAQALLVGAILHLLYKCKNENTIATLPALDAMFSDPKRPVEQLWDEMTKYPHFEGEPHPVVAMTGRDMIDRPADEGASVLSTAKSHLVLYRDPIVAKNVSKSDFRIADLMNPDCPVTLYIVTQPNDKNRLRPVIRVMVNMIVKKLADKMQFIDGRPVLDEKRKLLMMLDEFPSLGKLEIMQESLAFIAGYGIKCYIIVQDINQLQNPITGYGKEESITSNCHIQNAFPPNRIETAEHLSKLTGQTTVVKEHITTSGKRAGAVLSEVSRTMHEVQRPLLTPDECRSMPGPEKDTNGFIQEPGAMVVYVAGHPAIYGEQPLYFKNRMFSKRAAIPAPKKSDRIIHIPAPQREDA